MTPTVRRLLGCLAALLLALPTQAQDAALQQGIEAYQAADYDTARGLLTGVVAEESDKEVLKEALRYLAHLHIAEEDNVAARAAIDQLLSLEPPLVELSSDVDPPDVMHIYWQARGDLLGSPAVERPDPGMKTLAVMDFANTSVDEYERFEAMEQGFASMMVHDLQGATGLKVVERERIRWLLDELELQRDDGLVDQESAVETGRLLGVNAVLFGSFMVHGKRMWLTARLVSVETGEILLVEQIEGKRDDFMDLASTLAARVADAIDVEISQETRGETRSPDAQLAFSRGLKLIDEGRYEQAHAAFIEALAHDPDYALARQRAESLKPYLG